MSRFAYQAIRESGERISGSLRCGSEQEAVRKLMGLGYHPLSLAPQQETTGLNGAFSRQSLRRVSLSELAVFTRQMSSLLKAGLPMIQTLSTLHRQCANPRLAQVVEDLEETLQQDAGTLSDALEHHPKLFSPVYRGLVRSGEEGGNLAEVLGHLSKHLSQSAKLRGQVIGAFIYPIFLLVLGTAAIFVLMTFVIPKFQELFESFGQQLPWPTKVLIAVSTFLSSWWWAVLAALLLLILAGLSALRKPAIRRAVDGRLLRLPVLGQMFLKVEIARIAHTLGALLNSGVRILEALRITGDTAKNLALRETFTAITKGVSSGDSLASVIDQTGFYPPMMVNLIRTGEETGELPEMLQELSSIYEEEAERAITGAVKLLEPILIVIMGGIIAGIVAAVILPVFQANAMIAQ